MTNKSSLKSITLKTLSPIFLFHFSHFILSFPHIFSQMILKMEKAQIAVAALELAVTEVQLALAALELVVATLELAIAVLQLTFAALELTVTALELVVAVLELAITALELAIAVLQITVRSVLDRRLQCFRSPDRRDASDRRSRRFSLPLRCFILLQLATLHRRHFIGDASSFVRSATLHPLQLATLPATLQFATLRYFYFIFSFELIVFVNFCLMILVPLGIFV